MTQAMQGNPAIIGIDWGTSSLRAYLMSEQGDVLDRIARTSGILNVPDGDFAFVLEEACGKWMERWPHLPVLMCGMIGSRQGWREAPYLTGSAGPRELAGALITVATGRQKVQIVPGLQSRSFSGNPDVMRGEETILIGALALGAPRDGLYCLPGTHSKWVRMVDGRISAFSTFLTGEIYDSLSRRSVLSALIDGSTPAAGQSNLDAFVDGVDLAAREGGLMHQLFSIRAQVLTGHLDEASVADTLSGLLIGSELTSVQRQLEDHHENLVLVASGSMADRYRMALAHRGYGPLMQDAEMACRRGLCAIAREALGTSDPVAMTT